jgi:dolichol-phosphate mannosyltransferase
LRVDREVKIFYSYQPCSVTTIKYSIIVPVYNESETLYEMYKRVRVVMDDLDGPVELIFVNDGSEDHSMETMRELHASDPAVKIICFSRNFGHQMAITAGIDHALGQAVVVMDADLQDPPEVIPKLVEAWQLGAEVVLAVRASRLGESWFKRITASCFYRLINHLTDLEIPLDTGDFRLMDRKVVDVLKGVREHHRFMRGLSVWVGYKQAEVQYIRQQRFAGGTKYSLRQMMRFAVDGITSFSYVPLQFATTVGFLSAGLALLGIPVIVVLRLLGSAEFSGQATTLVSVLLLGGVQLIFLGVIGEYLGRIYDEVKRRPLYLVSERIGFSDAPD